MTTAKFHYWLVAPVLTGAIACIKDNKQLEPPAEVQVDIADVYSRKEKNYIAFGEIQ